MPYAKRPEKWKANSKKKTKPKSLWELEEEKKAREKELRASELDALIGKIDLIIEEDLKRKPKRRYHEGELEKFQQARSALWAIRGCYTKRPR